jgi:hypothetical protein
MDYATLKSDIATWSHRTNLTSVIPSFVRRAESDIFRMRKKPLRVREMEKEVVISENTVPSDYLEGRSIKDSNGVTLRYLPPENWKSYKNGYFTVIGNSIKIPDGVSGDLTLVYYGLPSALVNDADTSPVLDAYYDIYLTAALKQAHLHTKNIDAAQVAQTELDSMIDGANKTVVVGQLAMRPA